MPKNQTIQKNTALLSERAILVVEDDRTHRTLMEEILKEYGCMPISAENGVIALSKMDTGQHFDLIIMDWDMPELNGLETVKAIRAREVSKNKPHTPVIAFTTHRKQGDREICLASGMDAYLPKDIWMPKWRKTLLENLQGLIAGDFSLSNFEEKLENNDVQTLEFDLSAFDLHAFEQTACLLKDELEIALEEYFEDAAAYIRDIRIGLDTANAEKIARGSHPLKSNSKGFGLITVSRIAEFINKFAQEDNLKSVRDLLPNLQDAFLIGEKRLRKIVKNMEY